MESKTTINAKPTVERTRYVVSRDGIRMTYDEWLEMRKSEIE